MRDKLEKYLDRTTALPSRLHEEPGTDTGLFVVIPCYNEPDLVGTLESLNACIGIDASIEVIVVINEPEGCAPEVSRQNVQSYKNALMYSESVSRPDLYFHILYMEDLPVRRAGVGLARKIGMDEALRRVIKLNKLEIPIVNLDADCRCAPEYFRVVHEYFNSHPTVEGCSIAYRHRTEGLSDKHIRAIRAYEVHLESYVQGLRRAGYPFAFQTIGSAMAVRSGTYLDIGGMNTRKAGEDFYFLQKVIERGSFGEIEPILVYPSARISDRVPFGTGKAMKDFLSGTVPVTYSSNTYRDLKALVDAVPDLVEDNDVELSFKSLPDSIRAFLEGQGLRGRIQEIREHTATQQARVKRFYRWFNAFRVMKFMHFARDNYYSDEEVKV